MIFRSKRTHTEGMQAGIARSFTMNKPLAITLGDATGIGPEIVAKTLCDPRVMHEHPAFVLGAAPVLERAVHAWAPQARVRRIASVSAHVPRPDCIDVLDLGELPDLPDLPNLPHGRLDARAGRAAFRAIETGIALAMAGEIAGLCTAPIHKEALAMAGVPFPGHTEMLSVLSGSEDTAMMLVSPQLRTMLVTVHCSLGEAIRLISKSRVLRVIRLAHRSLLDMGINKPRIAVAGLNPHAGEGGLFGHEDLNAIAPAIVEARDEGLDVSGPHPGDTVFMQARRGRYDIVIAMYHDQGLIPIKLLGVEDGVNVTVGLPFVRTSPDHGTAFDIAGQGIADPASLHAALRLAHELARARAARSASH
jgi:4-hydroxythreonine-4-phosphate dehydrogenase